MHCYCGTNNRAPQWTFSDPYKPEVRPGAQYELILLFIYYSYRKIIQMLYEYNTEDTLLCVIMKI